MSIIKTTISVRDTIEIPAPVVGNNGNWWAWDSSKDNFVDTGVKAKGEDGRSIRYLGETTRIHPDYNGNYLSLDGSKWLTAVEGEYVYLVGDHERRGGDKDTYYIVRERKNKTVWEKYPIKGEPGKPGEDVDPALLDAILSELGDAKTAVGILQKLTKKLQQGKLNINALPYHLRWLLDAFNNGETTVAGGLLLSRIIGLSNQEGRITAQLSGYNSPDGKVLRAGIDYNVQRTKSRIIDYLRKLGFDTSEFSFALSAGASYAYDKLINWAKKQPEPYAKLMADIRGRVVALPDQFKLTDEITITHPTDTGRERVAIHHNGTGHFGEIYLQGNRIDYKTSPTAHPYLSVGSENATFIDDFVGSVRTDDTPINESRVELEDEKRNAWIRTFEAIGDDTKVTITIDKLVANVYKYNGMTPGYIKVESFLNLSLDGKLIDDWQGFLNIDHPNPEPNPFEPSPDPFEPRPHTPTLSLMQNRAGGGFVERPAEASNLVYTLYVPKGRHTLKLAIVGNNGGSATIEGIRLSRYYDSGATQTYIRGSGLRFFGSADRYVDIDYRDRLWREHISYQFTNPYTMRIKGGLKVDRIEAEELDMPGTPLCGARFNQYGTEVKSFGKYKNRRGQNRASADYDNSQGMRCYKVYHSIGHTNYFPIVQLIGSHSNNDMWNLTPRVYGIEADCFYLRIFTNNDNPTQNGFSYVAFKTV